MRVGVGGVGVVVGGGRGDSPTKTERASEL